MCSFFVFSKRLSQPSKSWLKFFGQDTLTASYAHPGYSLSSQCTLRSFGFLLPIALAFICSEELGWSGVKHWSLWWRTLHPRLSTSLNQFEQPRSSWAQTRSPSLMEDLADVTGLKARNKTEEVGCINFPRDWQLSPSCFCCGDIWYVYVYIHILHVLYYMYTSSTLQPPKQSTMAWFAA